jgi:hypothetical protein
VATFLVPLAGLATPQGGHWDTVLVGAAAINLAAGRVAKGCCSRCAGGGRSGRAEADGGPGSYRLPCKNMKDQIAATGAAAR